MAVYDPIAEQYKQIRENVAYVYVEKYTYLSKLGNITGKSILDVGCGEGIFSRIFKQEGAARVVGVDISSKMIELAKEEEARRPLGIEYIVGDMRELGKIGSFDLVGAAFSLNHAKTKEELREMCQTIYENLKPNGRFVCLNNNLEQTLESYERVTKYGCTKSTNSSLEEGSPISVYVFDIKGEKISIDDY
ncbi:class I SAM-dependent DNA methyltransferase [Microseira sp. BLCC-F43]|jgi:2-polyprenyl-3-methyl-5-hydroxy-6-metoxy-1,4-benzoquinol methylase|uniref:class I SAM-dependent DNA methyltransferase n=1 Tax=Microseira sp. BLCC-F43 TaxID=3153602 RepID=UPI0035B83F62